MSRENQKSVTLWYLGGCSATFYELRDDGKIPISTVEFRDKAFLAFRQVDILTIAPPAVQFLRNLTSLQIQNNHLCTLPSEIWRLTNLQLLNVGHNRLSDLPIEIGLLSNLKELYVHHNEIKVIPSQVSNMTDLTVLDLTDNQLNYLPAEVTRMELKNLWIDNNPFQLVESKKNEFISLKTICLQIIGTICLQDEVSRQTIQQEVDLLQPFPELSIQDPQLLAKCFDCDQYLFHSNLNYFKPGKIPLLYKACSQQCLINIIGRD
ncbi:uncharacterized protein EV154DRAFT_476604 [Mucor mucedo]|uniref:uncharacterized protein n=1 Tax=Mucor mucedo TaxID=29922 RepID=UPI002221008F|nr:uncharacterized protein EV154DRAFT_476604 [Mucor mucedo]KAI7896237.1 hypothetical protein EV154DRAFT_476604 [Mucor mucedo]